MFYNHPKGRDGLHAICKTCLLEKSSEHYHAHAPSKRVRRKTRKIRTYRRGENSVRHLAEYQQDYKRKLKFGITLAQYNQMVKDQGGVCKICNKSETAINKKTGKVIALAVDHCHKTRRVRGLLCHSCNQMLGSSKDDCTILSRAIEYLQNDAEWVVIKKRRVSRSKDSLEISPES